MEKAIAHVRQDSIGVWAEPQGLEEHLAGTAVLAEEFARSFGSGAWGRAVGLGHDIGKSPEAWQQYLKRKSGYDENAHLETKPGTMDHSTPGAQITEEVFGKGIGRILSYCIAGHHAGLPDWLESQSALSFRLQNATTKGIPAEYRERLAACRPQEPPWKFDGKGLDLSLWIRMLFSCLVDADFLNTEAYMESKNSELRSGYLSIRDLLERFNAYMDKKIRTAADTPVNKVRQQVLADCRSAARMRPGFFSLTVPTGGGKTLSSMAFALGHALEHGKKRVIYVIPYTSIIEQNADVFCAAVGADQVVEHHSSLDEDDSTPRSRLAAENWDAPIIVTTSVQFFESLFATRTSRCRKLHNIANSVVILDEAQLVPAEFLAPILEAMRLLVEHYSVSFVICTATQPAFEVRGDAPEFSGLPAGSVLEIVQNVSELYRNLKRVEVSPIDTKTQRSWEEIAAELSALDQILCVVSDRKSCRELHRLMPEGTYHLSALMCAQHRTDLIAEIKDRLRGKSPVRVISTQLVEAGVDIDFPVVYRALAGLDSIAQAAGRCNREGKLNAEGKLGKVVAFVPPRKAPAGILRKAAETAARLLENGFIDPIGHEVFLPYFSELYWKVNSLDVRRILELLRPDSSDCGIQFRSAAEAFRIIDDRQQRTILVPYEEGEKLIGQLKNIGPERWLLRKLQRYAVNVYINQFAVLQARGSLAEVAPGVFALICAVEYDKRVGLLVEELPTDPTSYMAFS